MPVWYNSENEQELLFFLSKNAFGWFPTRFRLCLECFGLVFLVSPPRGGRGFTITSEKWSLMNNFSCVVKCHNLLRLPHKMKFLVPWFLISSFLSFFDEVLKFFFNAFFVCVVLWSVTIYCACHTKWGSSSLVSSCLHVQFLFDEVLFSLFFRLCGLCDVSQSIAPATQNHVPCPMILNFYIFYHFLKNDEFAFFYSRSLLVATTDDVGEK